MHAGTGRLDIGHVDDAGVRFAQRHFAEDGGHVGFLAGGRQRHARPVHGLGRVTPAGNHRRTEDDDQARVGQVGQRADVFRIPRAHHDLQSVASEDRW